MLMADGTLRVLVGQLSISDVVTTAVQPVRLLLTDASGSVTCCVCNVKFLFTLKNFPSSIWSQV